MKALLQRVSQAFVHVDGSVVGNIDSGLLVLLGIFRGDEEVHANKLMNKIFNYRVFTDSQQKMNLSLKDTQGGLLIVSQFTLAADTTKGLRPSFSSAASPESARILYDYFIERSKEIAKESGNTVSSGVFGANMQVSLTNDGPVTFLLES